MMIARRFTFANTSRSATARGSRFARENCSRCWFRRRSFCYRRLAMDEERDLVWETLVNAKGILAATRRHPFLCRVLELAIAAYEAGTEEELAGRLEPEPARRYEVGFWV